ncbi:hypothetical protein DO97_12535 [Neosynechococcus sphagnicola sy1]|uniref:Uncharacterized protein n=1 Tax=Neosynechococcus sphagnicola sy1 TaxID=1497020 RepID=A0A098TMZ7_9CYAN|nr:hypothetical protein [Neosynechococcus sphagnicola]KGF73664.1 hypothetical protein DO97_12535 [Neosynechococcus sphagnicola sy1]
MSSNENEQEIKQLTVNSNHESSENTAEMEIEPSSPHKEDYGSRDKLYIYASAIELIIGISLVYIPIIPLIPIIPSILIGSGLATFVYRFMGGIKQEDSLAMGGIKIGGAIATLLGTATIISQLLDQQVSNMGVLLTAPAGVNKDDVFILRKTTGELLPLIKVGNGYRRELILGDASNFLVDKDFTNLNPVKSSCLDGNGLCKDSFKPVLFSIDPRLKLHQAAICEELYNRLQSIPMQIKLEDDNRISRVSITKSQPCDSKPNEPMRMYIAFFTLVRRSSNSE